MQCHHFDAHRCRSCSLLGTAYAAQLADKVTSAGAVLEAVVPASAWRDPFASREESFRNKAKMVVGGTPGEVTLGILDAHRRGVDLRDCGLHEEPLRAALPVIGELVDELRLLPYDVVKARGELKHVHATVSPAGELMVRFVLRSQRQADRLRESIPLLRQALPGLRVATINYLPTHTALLEGDEEEVLTPDRTLPMGLGRVTLELGPRSFFQTNSAVAAGLYEQVRDWLAADRPESLLDLYCGVGGFALYAATLPDPPAVVGVETSVEAVMSARQSLAALRSDGTALGDVRFDAADATNALADTEAIVVNPPRRGIGDQLCRAIEAGPARTLVYSSCNPETLATDLARLPSFGVQQARLFDMFPQTGHSEVLVLATR